MKASAIVAGTLYGTGGPNDTRFDSLRPALVLDTEPWCRRSHYGGRADYWPDPNGQGFGRQYHDTHRGILVVQPFTSLRDDEPFEITAERGAEILAGMRAQASSRTVCAPEPEGIDGYHLAVMRPQEIVKTWEEAGADRVARTARLREENAATDARLRELAAVRERVLSVFGTDERERDAFGTYGPPAARDKITMAWDELETLLVEYHRAARSIELSR